MFRGITSIICIIFALTIGQPEQVFAQKSKSNTKRSAPRKSKSKGTLDEVVAKLKSQYQRGEINKGVIWAKLAAIKTKGLSKRSKVDIAMMQAHLLNDAGYPTVAAIYAAQAIHQSPNPYDNNTSAAWQLLANISTKNPIHNILDVVANDERLSKKEPRYFRSNWFYYVGNALAKNKKIAEAMAAYSKVQTTDRLFYPAKYQHAMLYVDSNDLNKALITLKPIVDPTTRSLTPLQTQDAMKIQDYAYLAIGRIFYEQEKFISAVRAYRAVSRDNPTFYDALFEQSWALFLSGYPQHALGALHSVESPFFKEVFNPEAPVLRSLIHYWLCRYDDSKNALADFMERYSEGVEQLTEFLNRKRLGSNTAYQLFENYISGVSSDSLGLPRTLLQTAAEKESMLFVRDQYASVIDEKKVLEAKGIFGSKRAISRPVAYLDRWAKSLQEDLGTKFLRELQDMKVDYDRLYSQSQFLYVELLMSEKEQILGKELHGDSKITKVSDDLNVGNWASKSQSWKDSMIGEYWWDEIGYYITRVQPQCNVSR